MREIALRGLLIHTFVGIILTRGSSHQRQSGTSRRKENDPEGDSERRPRMRFLPYSRLDSLPNIIVDGAPARHTVLTLSHWPKSGTPAELKADTSAEIVFNYLDTPRFHVDADIVSNNHFDEDGLVGIFAMLQPVLAGRHRDLLIDVAQAGDFGVFADRRAARIALTISAYADADTSPLAGSLFTKPYVERAGELYVRLLDILPRLLTNPEEYRPLWESEDQKLSASEKLIEQGIVTIEEWADIELAVVRMPEELMPADCHPFAIHNRTACSRLLILRGRRVEFQYRYESWVQMKSRKPAPRVDLSALADELNQEEGSSGQWVFDGVDQITPRLHLEGSEDSSIPVDAIVKCIAHHLQTGRPAWNPYD